MNPAGLNISGAADDADDVDSTFSEDESSSASLADEVEDYRIIKNRRYHSINEFTGETKYWGCNDDKQNMVQEWTHEMFLCILSGELHLAPLSDNAEKVLDIGTGIGCWAIDFADKHKNAVVIGTDISPIQPQWVPPNLKFCIQNISHWNFSNNDIDFVHCRLLNGCIPDWYTYFQKVYGSLKPGGWFESHEISPHIRSDNDSVLGNSAMSRWGSLFVDGGKILGQPFDIVEQGVQKEAMEAAGFINIREEVYKIPIGGWQANKDLQSIGTLMKNALETDLEGTMLFMAVMLGWSDAQRDTFAKELRHELQSNDLHGYFYGKIVSGQKQVTP
ncbi:hypothetical protein M441DRAFT_81117 [Trichoderma asperellum CBS 433.97]|uniref:Methyltransferase domain-containing protein n=1 Tax=Trichoderma asperellum (strain ATCC 204424 / CBS 433.97 / NBRC 101777) TaxID=1042311 RepID=A0A2T3Z6D7_TRIA4|nr:hypothetical protein M441DRAFT_81117 [Trichoderma asperellum CBS 433.97]PTB40386.1 hypothetical protein M441DRAFT_81117 [Trichoderma asperellum CBS 433.97]